MSKPVKKCKRKAAVDIFRSLGKYSRPKTELHPFIGMGGKAVLLKDVLVSEGGAGRLFDEQVVFKLDDVDKERSADQVRPGVDIAFSLDSGKVLLVEAKFRVKVNNFNSRLKNGIDNKIKGSIDILSEPPLILRSPCVILISPTMSESTRRNIYRLGNGWPESFVLMTEEEFYNKFFEEASNTTPLLNT